MSTSGTTRPRGLYQRLQRFMEQNREDNLRYKTGWHERLQTIYLAHFELRDLPAGKPSPTAGKK